VTIFKRIITDMARTIALSANNAHGWMRQDNNPFLETE